MLLRQTIISREQQCLLPFFVFIFLILAHHVRAQTILSAGDIAVIGFKTNTSTDGGVDAIKLVTLVDLQCNTKFIVTDNGWKSTVTAGWSCNDNEFALEITCNTAISAGSVFYFGVGAAGDPGTCSGGSITKTSLGNPWGTDFGLSSGADNVFVLQGTRALPVFIFGIVNQSSFSASDPACNKQITGLPSGLTLGTNALAMSSSQNQWHYNCVTNNGTKATILAAICNQSNWLNTGGQSWDNTSGIFSVTSGALQYGVLAVSGAGCGCLSACELAYSGGVNCVAVTGDCSAGYQSMSHNIFVPSGCTYSVTAEMRNRNYGCSASGADGNCQGCDNVKVDVLAGSKIFQQGATNSSLFDSYSLAGPGTVVVSGSANRADEIITYTLWATPCACLDAILPIDLISFDAKKVEKSVEITWLTFSERYNSYFSIERSANAEDWEVISVVNGSQDNYSIKRNYTIYDSSPLQGISYYRLKQTDTNGKSTYFKMVSVDLNERKEKIIKRINIYGEAVDENATGIVILIYTNGRAEKIMK